MPDYFALHMTASRYIEVENSEFERPFFGEKRQQRQISNSPAIIFPSSEQAKVMAACYFPFITLNWSDWDDTLGTHAETIHCREDGDVEYSFRVTKADILMSDDGFPDLPCDFHDCDLHDWN